MNINHVWTKKRRDDYDDRNRSYLVNRWGICLIKSLLRSLIQSRLHLQTFYSRWCLSICLCVDRQKTNDQRQLNCSTMTDSRIEFQGESEVFFSVWTTDQSIERERDRENCSLTKAIFIHKGMLVVPAASAFNWIYCLSSLSLCFLQAIITLDSLVLECVCSMCQYGSTHR